MNVVNFLASRFGEQVNEVVNVLRSSGSGERSTTVNEALGNLVNLVQTEDELVAACTAVRRLLTAKDMSNPQQSRLFSLLNQLAEKQQSLCLGVAGTREKNDLRRVTLISAADTGPHLLLVFHYAIALLTQPKIEEIVIVFTGEMEWGRWRQDKRVENLALLMAKFAERLALVKDKYPSLRFAELRTTFELAPLAMSLGAKLGDVVIRFEGPAVFNTTHVFAKDIYEKHTVVTATFSSVVKNPKYSDLILARIGGAGEEEVPFVPPFVGLRYEQPKYPAGPVKKVVTVYGMGRIAIGLSKLQTSDWDGIVQLLKQVPELIWVLVGAQDPELAKKKVPEHVMRDWGDRIEVTGRADLDDLYSGAFAFLTFPNMFGGGMGASLAIAAGIPVLVGNEKNSDISGFIPAKGHTSGFADSVRRIALWAKSEPDWLDAINDQQELLKSRADLEAKGAELLNILKRAREQAGK